MDFVAFFEDIAMVVVIIIGISLVFVELQIRKIIKEELAFDERLRKDEKVLYNAEKVMTAEISDMKRMLHEWKQFEVSQRGGKTK